jgi:hypothetical protein
MARRLLSLSATARRVLWLVMAAVGVNSCVYATPIRGSVDEDEAPFYFPAGVEPSPRSEVVVDLSAAAATSFRVEIYDRAADDDLEYIWTLVTPSGPFQVVRDELRGGQRIGEVTVYSVPELTLPACQFPLQADGDEAAVELEIVDPIPEDQRFAAEADAYRILVRWTIRATGDCT